MKLKVKDIVCKLEQAIMLKELGIVQDSIFCFDKMEFDKNPHELGLFVNINCSKTDSAVAAFTITELAPVIKHFIATQISEGINPHTHEKYKQKYVEFDESELLFKPEFVADIILLALEGKVITIEKINELL